MGDFARLEVHGGLQVLTRVEAKDVDDRGYGPCVVTRCDPTVTMEVTEGPWPDTPSGWNEAEAVMKAKNLEEFASTAVDLTSRVAVKE